MMRNYFGGFDSTISGLRVHWTFKMRLWTSWNICSLSVTKQT